MTPLSPLSLLAALPPKDDLPPVDPALSADFAALLVDIATEPTESVAAEGELAEPATSEGKSLPDPILIAIPAPIPAMPPAAILPGPGKILPEPTPLESAGQAPAPARQDHLYPLALPGRTAASPIQAPLPAFGAEMVPQPRARPAPVQYPQPVPLSVLAPVALVTPVLAREPAEAAAITAPLRQVLAAARLDTDRPVPPPAGTEPAALIVPTSAEGPPSTPNLTLREPLAQRPIDFAALVDRLAAARDAVQQQSMAIALPHAEFGRIALRFHYDETGLAVSMASPDPDFARAAAQALPPVQATAPVEQPLTGSGQNSSSAPADRGQGHGEAPAQTRQPPRDTLEQPSGQGAAEPHQEPTNRPGRQGIFA